MILLFSIVTWRSGEPGPVPICEFVMTTPQLFPLAALIVPISLLAIRPEALKKATPASAVVEPDSIFTPEIST